MSRCPHTLLRLQCDREAGHPGAHSDELPRGLATWYSNPPTDLLTSEDHRFIEPYHIVYDAQEPV